MENKIDELIKELRKIKEEIPLIKSNWLKTKFRNQNNQTKYLGREMSYHLWYLEKWSKRTDKLRTYFENIADKWKEDITDGKRILEIRAMWDR